ncbi:MAG: hypothetical protein FK734_16295 [Asgard group archaeon]|nr:hypothetical protein [Asgard group archaeon]
MQWTNFVQKRRINYEKLSVELLPITARSNSLFQEYNKRDRLDKWVEIKNDLMTREGRVCYFCKKEATDFHITEFWEFDDENNTMILKEMHQLCEMCYKIKRTDIWFFTDFGKEQLKNLGLCREDLIEHYCKVNDCSWKEFGEEWQKAVDAWRKRNQQLWTIDFGEYQLSK